ncbi:MAG: hypothetical protein JWO67_7414 [Streptosporangiaceae bacterium]|nr:hypothetical protein [Streptosporangiaceae bacterium]
MKKFVLATTLVLSAMSAAHAQLHNTNLTLCGASPGGMWSLAATGVDAAIKAGYPGSAATYQTSSGGPANVVQVKAGTCVLGIANDGDLANATQGKAPFKQPVAGLKAIGVLFDWLPVMWIARKDFADKYGIRDLGDLAVKKPPIHVVFNRKGLLTSDITDATLKSLGITAKEIKSWGGSVQYQASEEQSNLMQNGRADLLANTIFEGHRSIAEIAMGTELTMLSVPAKANEAMIKQFYLKPWTIKAGAFPWQKNDAQTVTTSIVLFADDRMSEQTAYDITKALLKHPEKVQGVSKAMEPFKTKIMIEQKVLSFHPGAIKAYKEAGLM